MNKVLRRRDTFVMNVEEEIEMFDCLPQEFRAYVAGHFEMIRQVKEFLNDILTAVITFN